jgi:ribosomal protein L24E
MANEVTSTSLSVLTTVQKKRSYKAKQKKNPKKKKWEKKAQLI